MKMADTKTTEIKCPACNGIGYPKVMQPVRPGRKIYPPPARNVAVRDNRGGRKSTTPPEQIARRCWYSPGRALKSPAA
jgi:hypothetical protein